MKLDKIISIPQARIIFASRDVQALQDAALRHYDYRCKTEVFNIARMLRNQLSHSATAEMTFDQTQVGLMGKVCEQGDAHAFTLLAKFTCINKRMNERYKETNPQ